MPQSLAELEAARSKLQQSDPNYRGKDRDNRGPELVTL